jgi:hypothetical protein
MPLPEHTADLAPIPEVSLFGATLISDCPLRSADLSMGAPAHRSSAGISAISAINRQQRLVCRSITMSITTIVIIILILLFLGALPTWPHSRNWGYRPGGALGIVLLVLIVLLLTDRVG